jgi:uncharacterized damage-inducible protein DinB
MEANAQTQTPSADTKQALIDLYKRESATTLKVLRAYPQDQSELRPHPDCPTARELAWKFVVEAVLGTLAIENRLDLSAGFPPAPEDLDEVIAQFEEASAGVVAAIQASDLAGTARFFVAPKTMGDIPMPAFLRFLMHDQIHHRGQFSIYLRMAGGKVPSIYGPSKDEPWM